MKLIKIITLLLIIILTSSKIYTQTTLSLSLSESLYKALEDNPEIKLINFNIERIKLEIKESTFDKKLTPLVEKQSEYKIMNLENQKQDIIDNIIYEVTLKYNNILILEYNLKYAEKNLEYTELTLKNTEKNYEAGLTDSITLEKAKENVRLKSEVLSNTTGDLKRSMMSLLLSINSNLDSSIRLTDELNLETSFVNLDNSIGELYTENRKIKLAKLNLEVKILEYETLTQISTTKNDIMRAKLDLEEAEIKLEKTKKEVYNDLVNKYLDYEKDLQQYNTAETTLSVSKKKYRMNQNKYDEGLITIGDLNNSELEMDYAYISNLQSISKVNLSKLLFYMMFN